jgi:serine/threonine-protein kinase RsbW
VCSEIHTLALELQGSEWAMLVDLGLTEALTNVIRHGYGETQRGRVMLTCISAADQWQLTLSDCGAPIPLALMRHSGESVFDFDPDDLQNIPEGGMGLALIRSCFDSVDYQVHQGCNRLLLTKHLDPPAT